MTNLKPKLKKKLLHVVAGKWVLHFREINVNFLRNLLNRERKFGIPGTRIEFYDAERGLKIDSV